MILAKVAPVIRGARTASSLIPFSIPSPLRPQQSQHSPLAVAFFTVARLTPSQIRVPYDFSGKVRLGSFQMLRQMTTQSSSHDEEKRKIEEIIKSVEERIIRIHENREQYEKVKNLKFALNFIYEFCKTVLFVLGAAYVWNISDKKKLVIHAGRKKDVK